MEDNGWMTAADFGEELPFGSFDDSENIVTTEPASDVIGKCPHCGCDVVDRDKAFFCSNYECNFALWKNNRFFESITKSMTREVAEELLKTGKVKLDGCKSVRTGNTFNCIVKMNLDEDQRAQFKIEFPKRKRDAEEV